MSSIHPYHASDATRSATPSRLRSVGCYLCDVHRGADKTPYSDLFPEASGTSQILASDAGGAFVMIDVAPVAAGHCLVVPNRHSYSMAQIDGLERRAVRKLASEALAAVRAGWGIEPVLFEHGACVGLSDADPDSCGIDHAHLHVLANEGSAPIDEVCGVALSPLDHLDGLDTLRRSAGESGYIYVESADGRAFGSSAPTFPSQALRRHFLAPSIEDPSVSWNWSDQVVFASSLGTVERVRRNLATLRSHWPIRANDNVTQQDPETQGPTR